MKFRFKISNAQYVGILACSLATSGLVIAMNASALAQAAAGQKGSLSAPSQTRPSQKPSENDLVVWPPELPNTYPHGTFQVYLQLRGNYVPVLQWKVSQGALPPGIRLEENGLLHGEAQRAGEFQFVLTVKDGGQPRQAVQKAFVIKVVEAITVAWKVPPHVNENRIEGSIEVSNTTADDMDLTFDVKAVADNGRATEIGYQRFPLKKGAVAMTLPFGEFLPHGGYMVYVNVVGEVAKRNAIYRQRMQTPAALQVLVGP